MLAVVLKFQSSRVLAGEYIWHRSMALFAFFGGGRDTSAWHLVAGKSQGGWKGGWATWTIRRAEVDERRQEQESMISYTSHIWHTHSIHAWYI